MTVNGDDGVSSMESAFSGSCIYWLLLLAEQNQFPSWSPSRFFRSCTAPWLFERFCAGELLAICFPH